MSIHRWSILFLFVLQLISTQNQATASWSENRFNQKLNSIPYTESRQYYVSTTGNDDNPGTLSLPLRNISTAEKRMNPGDICLIRTGTYRETVIVTKDRLTFENYLDEKVTVTGLDIVTQWVKYQNNIYKAQFLPDEKDDNPLLLRHIGRKGGLLTQVFVDNNLMTMARYPNLYGDLLNWNDHGGMVKIFLHGKFQFLELNQSWPDNFWTGGIFHGIVEKKFAPVQGVIGMHNEGYIVTCKEMTSGWKSSHESDFKKYIFTEQNGEISGIGRGFITNHLNALDTEKEWYWDKASNTLYLWVPNGKDPNTLRVEAQSRSFAFLLQDRTGVIINGLTIRAAGIQMKNTKECLISGCAILYPIPYYLHNNEFDGYSTVSIIEGVGNTIKNCYIAHSWGSGVLVDKGENNSLENNLIEDVNWMGSYNGNIQLGGRRTVIHGNTLRKSGRFLIHGIGVKAGKITYNDMYDCMLIGQDGGAFYTNGALGEGTEIAYNWIHSVIGVPWERAPDSGHNLTIGIYLDGGCKNFNVHHNVIWKMKYAVLLNPFAGNPPKSVVGNHVNYNTCWVSGPASIVTQNSNLYSENVMSNNLVNKKVGAIGEKQGNQLDENQVFEKRYFNQGEYILNVKDKSLLGSLTRNAENTSQQDIAGANHGGKFWRPGADTILIKKE